MQTGIFAGIDIGGTSIKYALMRVGQRAGALQGDLEETFAVPTQADAGPAAVIQQVRDIIAECRAKSPELRAVGIGVPGPVDPVTQVVLQAPNLKGWVDVPLQRELQAECPIPIFLENDANTAALAELHAGAGNDLQNMLYVTLGTGVGAAIIYDKTLLRGERGGAGEIGYTIVRADMQTAGADKADWHAGTLEEFVGRAGILRRAQALGFKPADAQPQTNSQSGSESKGDGLSRAPDFDVRDISMAAAAGDEAALRCLREVGAVLGIGIASALNLLGLTHVVIGGGISQVHPAMLQAARLTLAKRALPSIAKYAEIRIAAFGAGAGVLGAAWLAQATNK